MRRFDNLVANQLEVGVTDASIIGREVVVLEQTTSTNDAVLQIAARRGATMSSPPSAIQEGLVVFAEHQTSGRGQRGNRWESAGSKGLWFSILLRPEIQLSHAGRLTIWAMEAISDVICNRFGLQPTIKMPNDIQLDGRKVSGVLVEMRAQEKAPHLAVVGIGINVNQTCEDFPADLQDRAISLAMAFGRQVDRQTFAVALLRRLDQTYREKFSIPPITSSPVPIATRDIPAAKFRMV